MPVTNAWGKLGFCSESSITKNIHLVECQTEEIKIAKPEDIILVCGIIFRRGNYKKVDQLHFQIQGIDLAPEDSMMIMDNTDFRRVESLLCREEIKVGRFSIPISKTRNPNAILEMIEFISPVILKKYGVLASRA